MTKLEMATAIVATYKPCGVGEGAMINMIMDSNTKSELVALYSETGYEMRTRIIKHLHNTDAINTIVRSL